MCNRVWGLSVGRFHVARFAPDDDSIPASTATGARCCVGGAVRRDHLDRPPRMRGHGARTETGSVGVPGTRDGSVAGSGAPRRRRRKPPGVAHGPRSRHPARSVLGRGGLELRSAALDLELRRHLLRRRLVRRRHRSDSFDRRAGAGNGDRRYDLGEGEPGGSIRPQPAPDQGWTRVHLHDLGAAAQHPMGEFRGSEPPVHAEPARGWSPPHLGDRAVHRRDGRMSPRVHDRLRRFRTRARDHRSRRSPRALHIRRGRQSGHCPRRTRHRLGSAGQSLRIQRWRSDGDHEFRRRAGGVRVRWRPPAAASHTDRRGESDAILRVSRKERLDPLPHDRDRPARSREGLPLRCELPAPGRRGHQPRRDDDLHVEPAAGHRAHDAGWSDDLLGICERRRDVPDGAEREHHELQLPARWRRSGPAGEASAPAQDGFPGHHRGAQLRRRRAPDLDRERRRRHTRARVRSRPDGDGIHRRSRDLDYALGLRRARSPHVHQPRGLRANVCIRLRRQPDRGPRRDQRFWSRPRRHRVARVRRGPQRQGRHADRSRDRVPICKRDARDCVSKRPAAAPGGASRRRKRSLRLRRTRSARPQERARRWSLARYDFRVRRRRTDHGRRSRQWDGSKLDL